MFPPLYPEEEAFANEQVARIAVTGATGYVAANIVARLLESGHVVHGTTRSTKSPAALALMQLPYAKDNLKLFEADVLKSESFDEVFQDCSYVIHTASPFSNGVKKSDVEAKLVKPAVQGTENVLRAADRSPSVKRVVLTSSVAAIAGLSDERGEKYTFTEKDWSLAPSASQLPYYYSKREAEKKAWEIAKTAKHWDLAVMNPGLVMGPPAINRAEGESITTMRDIIKGDYSMACPKLGLAIVDVRDEAAAHCLALFHPNASGQRFILSTKTIDIQEVVEELSKLFPGKVKAPSMTLPRWVGRIVGPMMGISQDIVDLFGRPINEISNEKVQRELGLSFTPLPQTLKDMAVVMNEFKMIKL